MNNLKKKLLAGITFFSLFSTPLLAQETLPEMPDKLTIGKLTSFINEHNLNSVEEVLEALPERVRKNFVLIHRSGSLANVITSEEQPRVVLFTPDASLMLAFASNTTDVPELTNQIEFAQLRKNQGNWRFGILDFNSGELVRTEPEVCASCHGSEERARPIWESYPDWDSTYAQHEGQIDYDLKVKLLEIIGRKNDDPRLKHLIWSQSSDRLPQRHDLNDRKHAQASMAFGMEMASGQAQALFSRIKSHDNYLNARKNLFNCSGQFYNTGVFSGMGINSFDLHMDRLPGQNRYNSWSTGETNLNDLLILLVLHDLTRDYPELAEQLKQTENLALYPTEQFAVVKETMYDDLRERLKVLFFKKGQERQDDREAISMRYRTVIGAGLLRQVRQPVCDFFASQE